MGTLGGGVGGSLEPEWGVSDVEELESGGEDELDVLNDETFGGDLPAADFELGDFANQTAQLLSAETSNPSAPHRSLNPWSLQGEQTSLEASLSHLIEDDEDSSYFKTRGRAPDPSQLPAPTGLFNAPDFSSPFLDNYRHEKPVWGPPEEPSGHAMIMGQENGRPQPPPEPRPAILNQLPPSAASGKVKTLAEIEAEMLSSSGRRAGPNPTPPASFSQRVSGVMNLEDLERELKASQGHRAPSPPPPLPFPGQQAQHGGRLQPPPPGYDRSAGGADPTGSVHRFPPNHPLAGQPIPPQLLQELMEKQQHQRMTGSPLYRPPHMNPPNPHGPPPPWMNPQFQMAVRAHLAAGKPLPPGFPHPAVIFGGRLPPPGVRGPPPGFMGHPNGGPQPPLQLRFPRPGQGPAYGQPPPMEPRRPQPGRRMFADLADTPYGQHMRGVDPYAGLMSRREKEWLTKIQMMQLETDNPYQDDYYFTMLRNKAFAAERRKSGKEDPEPMFYSGALDGKEALPIVYVPPKLEGSLGKIPHLSMNFPRQLIDVTAAGTGTPDSGSPSPSPSQDSTLHRRTLTNLLMDVERMWDVLLDLEGKRVQLAAASEEEHKAALNTGIAEARESLSTRLCPDRLPIYLSLRKGRDLVGRLLACIGVEGAHHLLLRLLQVLPALVKREAGADLIRALFPPLLVVAKRMDSDQLVSALNVLNPDAFFGTVEAVDARNLFAYAIVVLLLAHASQRGLNLEEYTDGPVGPLCDPAVHALHKWHSRFPTAATLLRSSGYLSWLEGKWAKMLSEWVKEELGLESAPIVKALS